MKKLSLIVIITTLTMFMSVAVASDSGKGWWWTNNPFQYFHGTYDMIASGSCIHSENGYDADHSPIAPGKVYVGTTVASGTWTFYRGGSGKYTITNYATIIPTTDATGKLGIRKTTFTDVSFTYEITSFGDITVHAGGIDLIGSISIDRNTMTLLSADNIQVFSDPPGPPLWYTICNTARTLIRVGD
jgi:hypothetical protein